ncbi:MAG: transposase, partial [Pseudonocardia sp.]|nr:transposase [Pseudonocardia sp.]
MSFYSAVPSAASTPGDGGSGAGSGGLLETTLMVAVPVSALAWPVQAGSGGDGRSALVVAGAQRITAGESVAWCKVVAVAPALVRRDGRVQAAGHPCEHARLGAAERELDRRCGPDTIDQIAAEVAPTGKIKAVARREMSVAATIRATMLMTLMPDADAREVLSTLWGDLLEVPWRRAHTVPSPTVLSSWRAAIGAAPLQQLQRQVLGAVVAEHRDDATRDDDAEHHDDGAGRVEVGGGLRLGSIDGTVTRMPDTAANRAAFGTAGQAETGYPQIRHLHASDALTRATLAVVCGPSGGDKAEAEQGLLDRMLSEQPEVFGPDRLWIMDRNFPGVTRIKKMLGTGTHVLIRVKSDIRLPRIGGFATDGSYLARLSGGGTTLTVRVLEYLVNLDGQTTPELFCLITDLLDHHTHPAHQLAAAYRWRWDGSETALREAKSTIHDAGPGTGAILRSMTPELVRQEHAAWITATELVHAATRSAAAIAAPFRKGPRAGRPVAARHLSFTTARRTLITTVRAGTATATASLPEPARTSAHECALAVIGTARVTTDRHRHRDHKIKLRQPFPHAPAVSPLVPQPLTCTSAAPPRPDPQLLPSPTRTSLPGLDPGAPGQTAGSTPCPRPASPSVHTLEDHQRSARPCELHHLPGIGRTPGCCQCGEVAGPGASPEPSARDAPAEPQ